MSTLAFYDHRRQSYADSSPIYGRHNEEFMIGGYDDDGLDNRGEFAIYLYDFDKSSRFPLPAREHKPLSAQVCVFDDAFRAFRDFVIAGGLDALENAHLTCADDLSRLLISLGLRDISNNPLTPE